MNLNVNRQSHNFYEKCSNCTSFLFSRVWDVANYAINGQSVLNHYCQSLNLKPSDPKWIKFSSRVATNFGSFEIDILDGFFNLVQGLNGQSEDDVLFIANKCAKDVEFLYCLDELIQQYHASVKVSTLVRLVHICNGDLTATEGIIKKHGNLVKIENIIFDKSIDQLILSKLLNPSLLEEMIESPKGLEMVSKVVRSPLFSQIQSRESQRAFLKAAIKNTGIFPFHMNLLDRCGSSRWNESSFYSFLSFLSEDHPWRFFCFDSTVQYKIQSLFLKQASYRNSLAELINNKTFLKLSSSAQFRVLHELQRDPAQWSSILELLSDKEFCGLSLVAQEGVFNLKKIVSWSSMKEKFTLKELESLSKAFCGGSIEIPKNRVKFDEMLKMNKLDGLEELIKQDQIESFQKNALSNSLVLLAELKRYHLVKNPAQAKAGGDSYTLTESQMKLYLGANFKERSAFVDDTSWLKHNLDLFIEKVWSRLNFNIIATLLLLLAVSVTGIISDTSMLILSLVLLIPFFLLGFEVCFPIPFPFFIERRFEGLKNELLKILSQERADSNKIGFYHGANGDRGALYELYTQLRFALTMTSGLNDNAITVLREFDDAFSETLTVDEFKDDVARRWKKTSKLSYWYDHPEYYASRAISTNTGLFGNTGDMGECTLGYWQRDHSVNKVDHKAVLTSLLSRLWGTEINQEDLKVRVGEYNDLIGKMAKLSGGTLLQILIDKESVDELTLVTEAGGLPLSIELNGEDDKTDKPSKVLGLQKKDPDEYEQTLRGNWRSFTKRNHLCRNYFNFFATQQARVITHPSVLTDLEKVTIHKYDATIPETDNSCQTIQKRKELEQLRKQLRKMIREDVMRSLANGVKLEAGTIATHKGLLPVQRYFQYVMEGVFKEQVEFKIDAEKVLEARKKHVIEALKFAGRKDNKKFDKAMEELAQFEQAQAQAKSKRNSPKLGSDVHAKYGDLRVCELLMSKDHEDKTFIEILKGYPELRDLLEGRSSTFGSKNEVYVEKLLKSFDSQRKCLGLDGLEINDRDQMFLSRFMRLILIFQGLRMPKDQVVPLIVRYMAKMGFKEEEILLAVNLLSCDIFEKYIFIANDKLEQSRAKTEEVLKVNAKQCGVAFKTYFILQYILQAVQAKSGVGARYYKPVEELNGLELPESQPDLKKWIGELFAN